jgi:radical SAM-linked protein
MQTTESRRYLLGFYKKGNMRFISHLDLQRLFKRCIKRAGIEVDYSNGFNPHEKINIVHPLSLGFETDLDYFEIDTQKAYPEDQLMEGMNLALPEGIRFTFCREIPHSSRNSSSIAQNSLYEAILPSSQNLNIDGFIIQDRVTILKKDKKTKKMVEKDVKDWIVRIELLEETQAGSRLSLLLRSAPNETLNPVNLLESLCAFSGCPFDKESVRVTRKDLFARRDGELVSLSCYYEQEHQNG